MSAPDISANVMEQFKGSGVKDHSTILLGAGASVTSGLPDWDTFATRLLLRSNAVEDERVAELLLRRQDPLIVVEAAKAAREDSWNELLRECLYDGIDTDTQLSPSPLHLAVVGHFLAKMDATSLVTLNFDDILETALNEELAWHGEDVESIASERGRSNGNNRSRGLVDHLHGVITPTSAENVVLTLTDFTSLIEQTDSWQVDCLQRAVQKGALIIAGTSYRDPDLRQWLHSALKDKPQNHSAFVLLARQAFKLSKQDFLYIESAMSNQWRAIGLVPVLLQDHTDAAQIIRELRHVDNEDYKSPQERCGAIWNYHKDNFKEKQDAYVSLLGQEAQQLKRIFNTEQIDLSLWISDGQGDLVKWASQDRTYHTLATLRVVETGHDSEWIAGQALGADDTLFVDLGDSPTRRWNSVFAVPVTTEHPWLPPVTNAVITVGLPKLISEYEDEVGDSWKEYVKEIAVEWGGRIVKDVFRAASE